MAVSTNTTPSAPGIERMDLQQHDLSGPGREVVQNRVDISPEAPAFRHKHPGEEIIYVLEGSLEYQVETVHSVRNVATGVAAELATYVVEKGKPLLMVVS
jgi:quercetin dioxygenase-like cupin family protein